MSPRSKTVASTPLESLSFTQSGGVAGLRKGCDMPVGDLAPGVRAALTVLRRMKKKDRRTPGGRDMTLYRLRLQGPRGGKSMQFDEGTLPEKARPLIAFLSARARPVKSNRGRL